MSGACGPPAGYIYVKIYEMAGILLFLPIVHAPDGQRDCPRVVVFLLDGMAHVTIYSYGYPATSCIYKAGIAPTCDIERQVNHCIRHTATTAHSYNPHPAHQFSQDSRQLASASDNGTVNIWDTGTGKSVGTDCHGVFEISFDPIRSHIHTAVGTPVVQSSSATSSAHSAALLKRVEAPQEPQGCSYGLSSDGSWITYRGKDCPPNIGLVSLPSRELLWNWL